MPILVTGPPRKERCIFCDLIEQDLALPERVIYQNDEFVIRSPFAARFPFSVEIYPLEHSYDFVLMDHDQRLSLAAALREFIDIVPPQKISADRWYAGTADAIYQNLFILQEERPEVWGIVDGIDYYAP